MTLFSAASLLAWGLTVVNARIFRGPQFAIFAAVIVGVYTLTAVGFAPLGRGQVWWPAYVALHAIVYVHLCLLARPRMRPLWYRLLISIPASTFMAGTLLSFPWAIAGRLGFAPWLPELPYALALIGLWQSSRHPRSEVHIAIDETEVPGLDRHPLHQPATHPQAARPLRIVQISDPHLGPFMSVEKLADICQRAVDADPDLVLLTGDFLTMESQRDPGYLRRALAPLSALPGRCYACFGNHDHEAPDIVIGALEHNGIRLLLDEAEVAETAWGEVEILGFNFVFRDRAAHLSRVSAAHPRRPGLMRLALLHDPGAFRHLPPGAADLVFAGHTHGGQLGLLSLGGLWTVPRLIDMPDHGLWARGRERMYVHRGTGHYGFPLRLGVPAEEGVIHVHFQRQPGQRKPEAGPGAPTAPTAPADLLA
jgi:predicted MPP superfamily phosphohydrolase